MRPARGKRVRFSSVSFSLTSGKISKGGFFSWWIRAKKPSACNGGIQRVNFDLVSRNRYRYTTLDLPTEIGATIFTGFFPWVMQTLFVTWLRKLLKTSLRNFLNTRKACLSVDDRSGRRLNSYFCKSSLTTCHLSSNILIFLLTHSFV